MLHEGLYEQIINKSSETEIDNIDNENMFHWQTQSTISDTSITGRRYRSKNSDKGYALLFVREQKSDEYGPQPYVFLGTVKYLSHKGSRPMNVVWKMDIPITAKFIKQTNTLTVV